MLNKAKLTLRVTTDAYDEEILLLIRAGIADLIAAGIDVHYSKVVQNNRTNIVISDDLIATTVLTFVRCRFGNPDNYENLKAAYDELKGQLQRDSRHRKNGEC